LVRCRRIPLDVEIPWRPLPLHTATDTGGHVWSYLAKLGVDATAGLGVGYRGLHATDECIDLSTIPMIQATYHEAVLSLLTV
jgi:acetylornithine deacetylase/succinyl-diaminopimelate desuccinylase-like protein